jgi:hypothetical protein
MILAGIASGQQRERDREQVRCSGKLKGVGPGVLQVESDKGERWLIAVESRPQEISFQGSATPEFLRAGMLVQFNAALDKKGEAQDPIREIKVVAQRMGLQLGLQPGTAAGGGLFNSDDESKKKKKGRADTAPYLVTGTLRSIKDGRMYVAAGSTVKAELADNCQVAVDISDISLAREGDNVEVEGWRYANQANQVYARRVTITTDKLLGGESKRRPTIKGDQESQQERPTRKSDAEGKGKTKGEDPKKEQ